MDFKDLINTQRSKHTMHSIVLMAVGHSLLYYGLLLVGAKIVNLIGIEDMIVEKTA